MLFKQVQQSNTVSIKNFAFLLNTKQKTRQNKNKQKTLFFLLQQFYKEQKKNYKEIV